MMKRSIIILVFALLASPLSEGKARLNLPYFLKELTSPSSLSEFPTPPYKALQVSSRDRASVVQGQPEWFANNDGFGIERTDTIDGRVEKVLFDHSGPGVITRFWMTTRSPSGTLRFYFDGDPQPGWVIPAFDLTQIGIPGLGGLLCPHTSYSKGISGGSTLFLPIPFSKACKVTFEEPIGWEGVPRYYHINFRAYPEDTEIETFGPNSVTRYLSDIRRAGREMNRMPRARGRKATALQSVSGDGAKIHLFLKAAKRGSVVRRLSFDVTSSDSTKLGRIMDNLIVRISCDSISCIDVPLSFLAGAGLEAPEVRSRYLGCDGKGHVDVAFPMPFKREMEICVVNYSDEHADITISANVSNYRFTDNTMYLKTAFKEDKGLLISNILEDNYDWNFTELGGGKGVYVADVLSMYNHSRAWYGEGDEKIYVDNETFPSHFGTGTEDYYNSSWAPVIPFHTAFGGAPRADLPSSAGYNTFFRSRGLDVIPFCESLRFDLEMISWMRGTIDFYNTVFFYGSSDTAPKCEAVFPFACDYLDNPVDPSEYRIEGSYEFESIRPTGKTENLQVDVQPMAAFPDGLWSRGNQVVCTPGHPGDWLEYTFHTEETGTVDLHVYVTKAGDYGRIRISSGGKSENYDAFGYGVTNGKVILKDIFVDKDLPVRIEITGKNEKSLGYFVGLDCITLNKTDNNQ